MKIIIKEKILPLITLKYYHTPKKTSNREKSGITCAWCLDTNIVNIGGGFYDQKGKIHQICEDCAVIRYKEDFKIKSIKVARARRRRIFDIGYLFNEMVIDKYIEIKNLKDFKNIKSGKENDIFIEAGKLFNELFIKEEKLRIEVIENQKDIEEIFRKKLEPINFKEYFDKLKM